MVFKGGYMTKENFKLITYFTQKEIETTGAKIEDIDFRTLKTLDRLRSKIGIPIKLQINGITTGRHSSPYHKFGKAVDFYFIKPINFRLVYDKMLLIGFNGIGIYWNGKMYSYHGDSGDSFRFWKAKKIKGVWQYSELIADPKG